MNKSRNTLQREIVLNTVKDMQTHPTADDVYQQIRLKYPRISKGTIYRNLGVLVKQEKITKIFTPNGPDRYDYRKDSHYHLHCEKCNDFVDIEIPDKHDTLQAISSENEVIINSYDITFSGICNSCLQNHFEEEIKNGRNH